MKNALNLIISFISISTLAQERSFVIESKVLSRKVEVFTYDTHPVDQEKPIVYITDGKKFITNGSLEKIKSLTNQRRIPLAYYVFVSTKDIESGEDHRNEYFFTNPDYLTFFEKELIPEVEKNMKDIEAEDRSHIGISFGGLNAAYFSARSDKFKHFGILSPITYPRKNVYKDIAFSENKELKIFLSTGKNDAEVYTEKLHELYKSKSYTVKNVHTQGGHNFDNWNKLLEEMLNFLLR